MQHGACLPLARGRWATQMPWTEVMALQQISERWEHLRSPRCDVAVRARAHTHKRQERKSHDYSGRYAHTRVTETALLGSDKLVSLGSISRTDHRTPTSGKQGGTRGGPLHGFANGSAAGARHKGTPCTRAAASGPGGAGLPGDAASTAPP